MAYTMADIEMVDRHIAQGERHIVRQEQLISRLRERSLPTEEAERLLCQFQDSLREHRAHRGIMWDSLCSDSGPL